MILLLYCARKPNNEALIILQCHTLLMRVCRIVVFGVLNLITCRLPCYGLKSVAEAQGVVVLILIVFLYGNYLI